MAPLFHHPHTEHLIPPGLKVRIILPLRPRTTHRSIQPESYRLSAILSTAHPYCAEAATTSRIDSAHGADSWARWDRTTGITEVGFLKHSGGGLLCSNI